MFKLQLQLVPPSALAAPQHSNLGNLGFNNSQTAANMSGISLNNLPPHQLFRRDQNGLFSMANQSFNLSTVPRSNRNIKRILHFTKKTNDLQKLCDEVVDKVEKMYPDLTTEIEIETLQDQSGCDLDPDFIVGDVFASDNVVQVLLKNDIDWDDYVPVSGYGRKRAKISETRRISTNGQIVNRASSTQEHDHENYATTRRTSLQPGKGMMYKGVRVSTPLVHQIHRTLPDSEENIADPKDKSLLLPPTVPQSPPIRISSGMEIGKQIKTLVIDDTVSRSETVDPSKSKQQVLQFESPKMPVVTPKRANINKPNVILDASVDEYSYSENKISSVKRHSSLQTPNIIRDMPTHIQQNQHQVAPGSTPLPQSNNIQHKLPKSSTKSLFSQQVVVNPNRTADTMHIDNIISATTTNNSIEHTTQEQVKSGPRTLKRQQSTIADNNGSPVKNGPLENIGVDLTNQVHLAALPNGRNVPRNAYDTVTPNVHSSASTLNTNNMVRVTYENGKMVRNIEPAPLTQTTLPNDNVISKSSTIGELLKNNPGSNRSGRPNSTKSSPGRKKVESTSFQKKHLIDVLHSKNSEVPAWLKKGSIKPQRKHLKKPYTTVLNSDIDNSEPDARNILPKRTPRDAAKKAAEKMAENKENESFNRFNSAGDGESDTSSSSDGTESESGIQTDYYSDDDMPSKLNFSQAKSKKYPTKIIAPTEEAVVSRTDISFSDYNKHQSNPTSSTPAASSDQNDSHISKSNISKDTEVMMTNGGSPKTINKEIIESPPPGRHELDDVPQSTQPESRTAHGLSKMQLVNNSESQNTSIVLQTAPQKVRPSLYTIADIDSKKYEKLSKNETLEIPLVHDTSSSDLGESTSSDLSSDGSSDIEMS